MRTTMRCVLGLSTLCACGGEREVNGTAWIPTTAADGGDEGDDGEGSEDDGSDGGGSEGGDGASDAGDGAHTSGAHTDDGGSDGGTPTDVPELGGTFTVIGTSADGLASVRDLDFPPDHPDQLWTANADIHGVVIYFDPGESAQDSEVRVDYYGRHFMATVSSLSFGVGNEFASCQESRDEWNGVEQYPDDFMGPTLWSADLDIFAMVHQGNDDGEGSHLDMLHQSPLCMGIAWDQGNAYWVFDGLNGHVVRYDFQSDHGPGGGDHSDGSTRRFLNATLTRREGVPGHMALDHDSAKLYVADTGAGRVMWLDTLSGEYNGPLEGNWDGVGDYSGWDSATWQPFASGLSS
ncbi:MAG TPA: hypothetical protein VG755_07900, partial [Nannocystaceae bacterium]|nr:hypothetical protein [Nannocystaceae bacterium]